MADFWPLVGFVFDGPVDDPKAFAKTIGTEAGQAALAQAREALATVEPFEADAIEAALRELADQRQVKAGQVFQPVRVALAGTTVSPGIGDTVALLGREASLSRIDAALSRAGDARERKSESALNRDRVSADRWANGWGYSHQGRPAHACARQEGQVN